MSLTDRRPRRERKWNYPRVRGPPSRDEEASEKEPRESAKTEVTENDTPASIH